MKEPTLIIFKQLQQATNDLLLMSESTSPLTVFCWESVATPIPASQILAKTNHSPDTPIELVNIDAFFQNFVTAQDWHNQTEQETVKRFKILVATIKNNLNNLQVYRIGQRQIEVYIIGTTESGDLVGLSSTIVET